MSDLTTSATQEAIAEVRQSIIDTLLEIDHIALQVNPRILANYAKCIGCLENDLYKWQLEARRMKRKFTLAQASANRGESFSLEIIDRALDEEFARWEFELSQRMAEQLELLERYVETRRLSPSEAREIRALHRKLIKRLHPDLHPNLPEEACRFFAIAQSAYESGDIETLRAVDIASQDYEELDACNSSENERELELTMVQAQLNVVEDQLTALKRSYPYVLSELLDDPLELARRKHELEEEIERQKEAVKAYEGKIAQLTKECFEQGDSLVQKEEICRTNH
jgi:hypothetical protein